jgi:hypothetical protein
LRFSTLETLRTNEERLANMALKVAAQGVHSDFGFHSQIVLSLTDLLSTFLFDQI